MEMDYWANRHGEERNWAKNSEKRNFWERMIAKLAIRGEGKEKLQLAVNWTIWFFTLSSLKSDRGGDNCMIIAKHGHHHKISMPIYCFHSSDGEVTYLDRGSVVEGACLLAGWSHPASWPGTMLTWARLSQEFSPANRLQVVSLVTITSRPRCLSSLPKRPLEVLGQEKMWLENPLALSSADVAFPKKKRRKWIPESGRLPIPSPDRPLCLAPAPAHRLLRHLLA